MRSKIIFLPILLLSLLSSCRNSERRSNNNFEDTESIAGASPRIDSLKWLYYALNVKSKAIFFDTVRATHDTVDIVECDVQLEFFKQSNPDTSKYFFTLKTDKGKFKGLEPMAYYSGLGIYQGRIFPIMNHVVFDYENNLDSLNVFMEGIETDFRTYLKTYPGRMTPWLQSEAVKRKIF